MTEIEHQPVAFNEQGATPPYRLVAIALAGALLAVVALVATAPLWAPLLPWAASPPPIDARLDRLERLEQRLAALEARPRPPTGDIAELRARLADLAAATAALRARVAAIDKSVATQAAHAGNAGNDTALALVLLQIRGAVAAGRPFASEYEALAGLVQSEPEIAKAAMPLAVAAKTGVASRAVLARTLRGLAATMARAEAPPPAAPGWTDATLARLRGLVTIRRIDAGATGGKHGAVEAAELALDGGDLAGAIAALDKLTGAPAAAAGPWLRLARERLAVDTALQQIEVRLTARLGEAMPAPAAPR
jgi:hypothetical protein